MLNNEETPKKEKIDLKEIISKPNELDGKSWKLIEKMVLAQSRQSRWSGIGKYMFRFLILSFVILLAFGIPQRYHPGFQGNMVKGPHIAQIKISGIISENTKTNASSINEALYKAFSGSSKAVILSINSPGGSPVQSDLIWQKINKLKEEFNKPIYAIIGDMGTSGAYYIASAADEIYANSNSVIGSIGVINATFGFNKLITDHGIERRVVSSGKHKGGNDPFIETNEVSTTRMQQIVNDIHERFKQIVIKSRKDKLKQDQLKDIFSGLVWTANESIKLGLIDNIKTIETLNYEIDNKLEIKDYSAKQSIFDRFTSKFGQVITESYLEMNSGKPFLF